MADVRTFDGVVHGTYREACLARNLLADDNEWHNCLEESLMHTPRQLRSLFLHILLECNPSDPKTLFAEFADELSADFLHQLKDHKLTEEQKKTEGHNLALEWVQHRLEDIGKLLDSSLNTETFQAWTNAPETERRSNPANRLVANELDYDRGQQATLAASAERSFNKEQWNMYQRVLECVDDAEASDFRNEHVVFADAPGGTGKTFVNSAICAKLRACGKIVLATASSGIAAQLMAGGRTAHSTFKIPVSTISEISPCSISKRSDNPVFVLMKKVQLIIIDEAAMLHWFVRCRTLKTERELLLVAFQSFSQAISVKFYQS